MNVADLANGGETLGETRWTWEDQTWAERCVLKLSDNQIKVVREKVRSVVDGENTRCIGFRYDLIGGAGWFCGQTTKAMTIREAMLWLGEETS